MIVLDAFRKSPLVDEFTRSVEITPALGATPTENSDVPLPRRRAQTPTDVKARILSTNINLDEGTCSITLVESAAEYFGLTLTGARNVIRGVGAAVSHWRDVAVAVGARRLRYSG